LHYWRASRGCREDLQKQGIVPFSPHSQAKPKVFQLFAMSTKSCLLIPCLNEKIERKKNYFSANCDSHLKTHFTSFKKKNSLF
jgi:hypothetical protein